MIYALYHVYTDTSMDDNGLPGWVDMIGGLVDMLIVIWLLTLTAEYLTSGFASLGMIA